MRMKSRARELNSQIEQLEQQISDLEHVSTSRNATEIRTTLEETSPLPKDPILSNDSTPAELFPPEPDSPRLYNDQGVRKFDLHGWWQRLKPDTAPEPTPNEKLVTYLAAGRNHGYTALRKETRVARNRLILSRSCSSPCSGAFSACSFRSCKRVWLATRWRRDSFFA